MLTLSYVFWGLLGLSILVFIHEMGHFWAARLCRIKVEAFSIGLGPVLCRWNSPKKTEFRLSLIPMGGYCKMTDEVTGIKSSEQINTSSIQSSSFSEEKNNSEITFPQAHPLKKMAVVLAGPFINILFCFFLFLIGYISFSKEESALSTKVIVPKENSFSEFKESTGSPAQKAGLITGDIITEINHHYVSYYNEVRDIILFNGGKEISLQYKRNGSIFETQITPYLNPETGLGLVGLLSWLEPLIGHIQPEGWAFHSGLKENEKILSINGIPIQNTWDFQQVVNSLTPAEEMTLITNEQKIYSTVPKEWGFYFYSPTKLIPPNKLNIALVHAWQETMRIMNLNIQGFTILFRGVELQKVVSGPAQIIYQTGKITQSALGSNEIWQLISFFGLLSIALGLTNLFPIPALDGGQFLLFLVEWLYRKPLPKRVVEIYQTIGVVILLSLFLLVTFSDFLSFL